MPHCSRRTNSSGSSSAASSARRCRLRRSRTRCSRSFAHPVSASRSGSPSMRCSDDWEVGLNPYRTTIDEVPLEQGLREDEGWIDMRVQFLIDARAAGSDQLVVGRTVPAPGARPEKPAHPNCDEFLVVMSGPGEIYTDAGREPSRAGDVIFT